MKRKGPLLAALVDGGPTCDRCLAVRLGLPRPQYVNSPGRKLVQQGRAVRVEAICSSCGHRRNVLAITDASQPLNLQTSPQFPAVRQRKPAIMNGHEALTALVTRAGYPSLEAAVAAHTLFLHPSTVAQTHGKALFPIVRGNARKGVHKFELLTDGRRVWVDNNIPVNRLFLWAAQRGRGVDVQCNHVWNTSNDPDGYTALWNLCLTPAFLAKATDSRGPAKDLLQYRAYDLYGQVPKGYYAPVRPQGYEDLKWLDFTPAVDDLEGMLRTCLRNRPNTSPGHVARQLGWLFSDWAPDDSLN